MKNGIKKSLSIILALVLCLQLCALLMQTAFAVTPYLNNPPSTISGQWLHGSGSNSERWWYKHSDNSYTTNDWEYINGYWYHFDSSGWMDTYWLQQGSVWYYLGSNGKMCTGWKQLGTHGNWYYFSESNSNYGVMCTGWEYIDGYWYYFNSNGVMQTGWVIIGNNWRFFDEDGHEISGATSIYTGDLPTPDYPENTQYSGEFASSYQCMAFAKMIYAKYYNMTESQFEHIYDMTYCSNMGSNDVVKKYAGFSSVSAAQNAFSGLTKGTYVRLKTKGALDADEGNGHSVIILSVNSNGVEVYDCNYMDSNNYTLSNRVHKHTISYSTIVERYDQIFIAIQHSWSSSNVFQYNSSYHILTCATPGCAGRKVQQHYAVTPGPNATCAACGYVGNIQIGLNAIEDEME